MTMTAREDSSQKNNSRHSSTQDVAATTAGMSSTVIAQAPLAKLLNFSSANYYESLPPDAPAPRLCTLVLQPKEAAFGFAIHGSDILFGGHFIAMLTGEGAARRAGVKLADRIIEVDGVDITNENYLQVAERIEVAKIAATVRLLVADEFTDEYYANRNMVITGRMPNVVVNESIAIKEEPNKPGMSRRQMSSTLTLRPRLTGPPTIFKEARDRLRGLPKDRRSLSRSSLISKRDSRKAKAENNNADAASFDESALSGYANRRDSVSTISTVNDQQSISNYDLQMGDTGTLYSMRRSRSSEPDCTLAESVDRASEYEEAQSRYRVDIDTIDENAELESLAAAGNELRDADDTDTKVAGLVKNVPPKSSVGTEKALHTDQNEDLVVWRSKIQQQDEKAKTDKSSRRRFRMFSRRADAKATSSESSE